MIGGGLLIPTASLPAARSGLGAQFAFRVDLDACSGCKSCVAACASLNGLDEGETWRMTGLVVGDEAGRHYEQTITTTCHHCLEPACLEGCPALAYEKDPDTGIVHHLDDQCIGCRYCMLMCPYEVPTYNARLGIVRKCDMCAGRLLDGEDPACVQACPSAAIAVDYVGREEIVMLTGVGGLVPGAPSSILTRPATRYVGTRAFPTDTVVAGVEADRPGPNHLPLVVMLVLTQLAVGVAVGVELAALLRPDVAGGIHAYAGPAALGVGALALSASIMHLGRPLVAYRAVLNLRRSWLSREIVLFGLFALIAVFVMLFPDLVELRSALVVVGLAAFWSSVMVYVATGRPQWGLARTATRFGLTTVVAGGAGVLVLAAATSTSELFVPLCLVLIAGAVSCAVFHVLVVGRHGLPALGDLCTSRLAALGVGGVFAPIVVLAETTITDPSEVVLMVAAVAALGVVVAGEVAERSLFFRVGGHSRMPGAPS